MNIKKNTHISPPKKNTLEKLYTRFMRVSTRISFFLFGQNTQTEWIQHYMEKNIIIAILMASDSDQTKIWGKHIKALNQNTKRKQSIN